MPIITDITNPEKNIYFAGLFDGEGCIYVSKLPKTQRTYYNLSVVLCMCHEEVIKDFHRFYDCGTVHARSRKTPSGLTAYAWSAHGKDALHVLEQLTPYLRTKKEQAKVAMQYQNNRKTLKLAEQEAIYLQLRQMKKGED